MSTPGASLRNEVSCHCEECATYTSIIALYMILYLEPTDRALRLAGDIYPVAEVPS
jgi:hypothetical protein